MKTTIRMKVFMGSVSALLGGVFLASAADVGTNYTLNAQFTGNPQDLAVVNGVPQFSSTDLIPNDFGIVMTDGSGRIDGVYDMMGTNLNLGPYSTGWFISDIRGNIRSIGKNAETKVNMIFKGNGYVQDDSGTQMSAARANFRFISSGGMAMHTSVVTPTTNVDVVVLSSDGTTNYDYHYSPYITMNYRPPITVIVVDRHYSDLTTNTPANGTNYLTQDNEIDGGWNYYWLGTPVTTDTNLTDITHIGTNTFTLYPLDVRITWNPNSGWNTNWGYYYGWPYEGYGFDIAQKDAVIAAIHDLYQDNVNTNSGQITTVKYVTYDIPSLDHSSTNDNLLQLSNTWAEIDGTLRGSIGAGKYRQNLNDEPATLSEGHSIYTLVDSTNGQYVTRQDFNSDNLNAIDISSAFDARVVTFGRQLWMSAYSGVSGKGNLNPKNDTFRSHLKGVAWSRGVNGKLIGSTGLLIDNYQWLTNIIEITDVAADPAASLMFTNDIPQYDFQYQFTTSTNSLDTNTVLRVNNNFYSVGVPPLFQTNSVPNGIKTFTGSGRAFGQRVLPTDGINPDAEFDYEILSPLPD